MTNIKTVFDYVNSEVRLRRSCLMIILMTRSITKLEERAQKYLEAIDVIKSILMPPVIALLVEIGLSMRR